MHGGPPEVWRSELSRKLPGPLRRSHFRAQTGPRVRQQWLAHWQWQAHWREGVCDHELMTPAIGGGVSPLSVVTVGQWDAVA